MSMPGFMTIMGEQQGPIEGSCDLAGREGEIELYDFRHKVEIPRHPGSGLPVGRRVHGELMINKETDKSTPKLYKALCEGEKLTEVEIRWYRYSGSTADENFYTVLLENALITRIEPKVLNRLDQPDAPFRHMEDVAFAYEKITWSWESDGIEYEDAWVDASGEAAR
ncbi:MAG: Hcp family type VI secretion system effector [Gammaproteobacteria bacterium]